MLLIFTVLAPITAFAAKAEYAVTMPAYQEIIFNGRPQALTPTVMNGNIPITDGAGTVWDIQYAGTGSTVYPPTGVSNITPPTNRGTYSATYVKHDQSYNIKAGSVTTTTFAIISGPMTGVTATGYNGEYTGTPHGLTLSGVPDNSTITYYEGTTATGTGLADLKYTVPGNYKISVKITNSNYQDFTINGVNVTITSGTQTDVSANNVNAVYDGSAKTINVVCPDVNAVITYDDGNGNYVSTQPSMIDVGEYTVNYKVERQYYGDYFGSATVTITDADLTGSVVFTDYNNVYDGNAHTISISASAGSVIKYKDTSGGFTLDNAPTYTNVGTYTVDFKITKTNYAAYVGTGTVTITKASMTADVTANGYNGVYDAAAHTISVTAPTGATITYGTSAGTYTLSSAPTYTNVGNYTVYYKVTNANYTDVTGSATVNITKATQTGITATAYSGIYDGNDHSITITGATGTISYSTNGNTSYNLSTNPTRKNVGITTVDFKVEKDNYFDYTSSSTITVTTRTLTVTPNALDKFYGETDPTLTYTTSNQIAGETAAFTGTLSRATGNAVGTYVVGLNTLALTSSGSFTASNYTLAFSSTPVNFTIKSYTPTEVATLSTSNVGNSQWFIGNAAFVAPTGFTISDSNALTGNTWAATLAVDSADASSKTGTYYLKNNTTGAITVAKTLNYKVDKTTPTGNIAFKTNNFATFINGITFDLFYKNTVNVTITGNDATSGVAKIEYQKVSAEANYNVNGTWTTASTFSVTANEQFAVYARITDNAGNQSIINSQGTVVYTDSVAVTTNISFTKHTTTPQTATVTLNGNTIKEIKKGSDTLVSGTDYTISGNTITFNASYLDSLNAGNYTLTVSYNPMGLTYNEVAGNEAPATTTISVTVVLSPLCSLISTDIPDAVISGDNITKTVPYETTSLTVGATVSPYATWKLYSNSACTQEITSKIMDLAVGANNAYIKVTAENGTSTNIYNVIITREASTECDITNVIIPGANISGNDITSTVPYIIGSLIIDVNVSANATWKLYSNANCTNEITNKIMTNLTVGTNVAYIKVTAQDVTTTQQYTVTITREPNNVPTIIDVNNENVTIDGTNITINVGNSTTSLPINIVVDEGQTWQLFLDPECTIPLTDNEFSNLAVGENIAYAKVVTQDGTFEVYTVTVNRAEAPVQPTTTKPTPAKENPKTGVPMNFAFVLVIVAAALVIKSRKINKV